MRSSGLNNLKPVPLPVAGARLAIAGEAGYPIAFGSGKAEDAILGDSPKLKSLSLDIEIQTRQGFDEFVRRSHLRLIRYYLSRRLRLEDAQDLAQDTILHHWRRRHDSKPPHLAFLFGIARRLYLAFLRKSKPGVLSLNELPDWADAGFRNPGDGSAPPLAYGGGFDVAEFLQSAKLTSQQRAVLQLRFVEGLSQRQVAEKMGLSRNSVKIHESRGLTALRGCMGKND